jgi:hypothetical protein
MSLEVLHQAQEIIDKCSRSFVIPASVHVDKDVVAQRCDEIET